MTNRGQVPAINRREGQAIRACPFTFQYHAHTRAMVAAKIANLKDGQTKSGAHRCAPEAVSQADAAEQLDVGAHCL